MTADRTWDPLRFQRGTRGFAAFVTALNALIVLGVAAVVAPASGLPDPAMAWVFIPASSAGSRISSRSWGWYAPGRGPARWWLTWRPVGSGSPCSRCS
ncbi:hypothetical protein BH20CHL7_BH20CHL7_19700 [soil metagenome]